MTNTDTKDRTEFWGGLDIGPEGDLPEPVRLTPEEHAEFRAREQAYRRECEAINKALRDNSMAVTRAMSQWHSRPGDREKKTAAVIGKFEDGSFLLNRLGAEGVIDQDLATILLHLRNRLIEEYGNGPAAMMLIDRAVAAHQALMRIEGWVGNLSILIEYEFFGIEGPTANFKNKYGSEGRRIRGLIFLAQRPSLDFKAALRRTHRIPPTAQPGYLMGIRLERYVAEGLTKLGCSEA